MKKVYIIENDDFKIIANNLNDFVNMCNTHLYEKLNDKEKKYHDKIDGKFRNIDINYLRKFTNNNIKSYLEYQDKFDFKKMPLREFYNCNDEIERKRLERKLKKKLSVDNQFIVKDTDIVKSAL